MKRMRVATVSAVAVVAVGAAALVTSSGEPATTIRTESGTEASADAGRVLEPSPSIAGISDRTPSAVIFDGAPVISLASVHLSSGDVVAGVAETEEIMSARMDEARNADSTAQTTERFRTADGQMVLSPSSPPEEAVRVTGFSAAGTVSAAEATRLFGGTAGDEEALVLIEVYPVDTARKSGTFGVWTSASLEPIATESAESAHYNYRPEPFEGSGDLAEATEVFTVLDDSPGFVVRIIAKGDLSDADIRSMVSSIQISLS